MKTHARLVAPHTPLHPTPTRLIAIQTPLLGVVARWTQGTCCFFVCSQTTSRSSRMLAASDGVDGGLLHRAAGKTTGDHGSPPSSAPFLPISFLLGWVFSALPRCRVAGASSVFSCSARRFTHVTRGSMNPAQPLVLSSAVEAPPPL